MSLLHLAGAAGCAVPSCGGRLPATSRHPGGTYSPGLRVCPRWDVHPPPRPIRIHPAACIHPLKGAVATPSSSIQMNIMWLNACLQLSCTCLFHMLAECVLADCVLIYTGDCPNTAPWRLVVVSVCGHYTRLSRPCLAGEIAPQPPLQHSLGNAAVALRQLGAAKTVGKMVTSAPAADAQPGRWVITGGLGALGTLCAR